MKEFARDFYFSPAWRKTRTAYMKSVGGLCEVCLAKGIVRPGEIVHHKVHLSPDNISDENVSLSWDNLQCVCRDCHARLHGEEKRFELDEYGRVIFK